MSRRGDPETVRLVVEKMIYGGYGLGHDKNGRVILVKKSVPNDVLEIDIIKTQKTFVEGAIKEIKQPGANRITPPCPHFGWCGGCDYQCLSYENQLKIKEEIFAETLERQGIELKPEPILAADGHLGDKRSANLTEALSGKGVQYRNNNRFFFIRTENGIELGRHNFLTKTPAPIKECFLQSDKLNLILRKLRQYFSENDIDNNLLWQLKVREGVKTGEILVEIITTNHELPNKEEMVTAIKKVANVKSIYHTVAQNKSLLTLWRRLIFGSPVIYDKIGKFTFQISPESFFQVNTLGAETLYDVVKQYADLKPNQTVLDLYCGTGTIGIYLSTLAKQVIGIESVPETILDAKANARINHIPNCQFICFDVEKYLHGLSSSGLLASRSLNEVRTRESRNLQPNFLDPGSHATGRDGNKKVDVIVLDPPRAGLSPNIIDSISETNFEKLIYISCDPPTFARDIVRFKEKGVVLVKVQPVDMFPQTHHIECVGLLTSE